MAHATQQDETFEALNGGLFRIGGYEFLGETREGVESWWHRGQSPRDVRHRILKSSLAPYVEITTWFRNVEGKTGEIISQVNTVGPRMRVVEATEKAILRLLEIYKDVLDGTGVARPEAAQQQAANPESTADSDVPDNLEDEKDAGLYE